MKQTTKNAPRSYLNSIDPQFEGSPLPLSRFFVHLTKRYDSFKEYHLQDEENREKFLLRVLNEVPRDRKSFHLPLPQQAIDYLNAKVPAPYPMTRIMSKIWLDEKCRFDLNKYQDYLKFLFFYADHIRNYFYYPDCLFPNFIFQYLNAPSASINNALLPLGVYMDELWQQRSFLHETYPDIDSPRDQIAYAFDFIVTVKTQHSQDLVLNSLIPPKVAEFFCSKADEMGKKTVLAHMILSLKEQISQERQEIKENPLLNLAAENPALTVRSLNLLGVEKKEERKSLADGVDIIGPYKSKSGLGHNVVMSQQALELKGVPHTLGDFSLNDATINNGKMAMAGQGKNRIKLMHVQPDNLPEMIAFFQREKAADEYYIGFFAWETNHQPEAHYLGIQMVDEIWVPTEYVAESFHKVTDNPVIAMPHAIEINEAVVWERSYFGLAEEDYLFHFSFDLHSWVDRKNPNAVVEAFQKAFPHNPGVKLVIKARNGYNYRHISSNPLGSWERVLEKQAIDDRIIIINDELSHDEAMNLIRCCDCYISLHRSEGFGYTVAEAMLLGKPCITTGYSGNLEYCDTDNCFLVEYDEVFIQPDQYIFYKGGQVWAEPRVEHAARLMQFVCENPAKAAEVGQKARTHIQENFSLGNMAGRYTKRLGEINQHLLSVAN